MGLMKTVSLCGLMVLSSSLARASAPTLQNLLPADYDAVVKEFSANFAYSTATGASGLGGWGNFEFGVAGGETTDPYLGNLVQQANPGQSFPSHLYHVSPFVRLGLPQELTIEGILFPKKTISGLTLQQYGGSVMWTPTRAGGLLSDLPIDLSAKFSAEKATVSYTQTTSGTISGVTQSVPVLLSFSDIEWALQAFASFKFLVFEPYVGIGYAHSDGTLNLATNGATVNIFSQSFTSAAQSNSAESIPSSFQYMGGVDFHLPILSIGVEAMKVFGETSYNGRVSFRF